VLLIAALALFWVRLSKVLHVIRNSMPTPDFDVKPLGLRIRQFLWEVMAQGKVLSEGRMSELRTRKEVQDAYVIG